MKHEYIHDEQHKNQSPVLPSFVKWKCFFSEIWIILFFVLLVFEKNRNFFFNFQKEKYFQFIINCFWIFMFVCMSYY